MHNARYGPGEEYNLIPYPISCKPHVLVFRGMNQTFRLDLDYRVRRLSVRFSALGGWTPKAGYRAPTLGTGYL